MKAFAKRVSVVLHALPTLLTTVAVAIPVLCSLVDAPGVVVVGAAVVSALTAAVGIIRRVTPVFDREVGLLPLGDPAR